MKCFIHFPSFFSKKKLSKFSLNIITLNRERYKKKEGGRGILFSTKKRDVDPILKRRLGDYYVSQQANLVQTVGKKSPNGEVCVTDAERRRLVTK